MSWFIKITRRIFHKKIISATFLSLCLHWLYLPWRTLASSRINLQASPSSAISLQPLSPISSDHFHRHLTISFFAFQQMFSSLGILKHLLYSSSYWHSFHAFYPSKSSLPDFSDNLWFSVQILQLCWSSTHHFLLLEQIFFSISVFPILLRCFVGFAQGPEFWTTQD